MAKDDWEWCQDVNGEWKKAHLVPRGSFRAFSLCRTRPYNLAWQATSKDMPRCKNCERAFEKIPESSS